MSGFLLSAFATSGPIVGALPARDGGAIEAFLAGTAPSQTILYTNNDGGPVSIFGAGPAISVIGEPIALVAWVGDAAGGALKPSGTVTFRDGTEVLGTAPINSSNVAVHVILPAPGAHSYTASYSGDPTFAPSASNPVTQSVGQDCSKVTGEIASAGPTVFRNGTWYQRTAYAVGMPGTCFSWGLPGDKPVLGDWDGDGDETIGVFRNGTWYLKDRSMAGNPDRSFNWGSPGDQPVVGDWDGNGSDTIGVFRNGTWYLRNSNTSGPPEVTLTWGASTDVPVVGDWDGNGTDTIGAYRNGTWFLNNSNTPGVVDATIPWGGADDQPVTGDWDADGTDTIGVYRDGSWMFRNANAPGGVDVNFLWGAPGDRATPGR